MAGYKVVTILNGTPDGLSPSNVHRHYHVEVSPPMRCGAYQVEGERKLSNYRADRRLVSTGCRSLQGHNSRPAQPSRERNRLPAAIAERAPRRDAERNQVGQRDLPGQRGRGLPGHEGTSLVDQDQDGPDHQGGQRRASQEGPVE